MNDDAKYVSETAEGSIDDILPKLHPVPAGYHYVAALDAWLPPGYTYDSGLGAVIAPDEEMTVIEERPTGEREHPPATGLPEHETLHAGAEHRGSGGNVHPEPSTQSGSETPAVRQPAAETPPVAPTSPTVAEAHPAQRPATPPAKQPAKQPAVPARLTRVGTSPPTTAADRALQVKVAAGTSTRSEALGFFQRNGHPELTTLPSFNARLHMWIFSQPGVIGPPLPPPVGDVIIGWPGGAAPKPQDVPKLVERHPEAPRYVSTFASETVSAGWRDAFDTNNPLLLRYVLLTLLPTAEIGAFVESSFVNPLLAAPANIVDAASLSISGDEALARGDIVQAAADKAAATGKLLEAGAAIATVLPITGSARLVGAAPRQAIQLTAKAQWLGPKAIVNARKVWMSNQVWVTGQYLEHQFLLDGKLIVPDGLVSRTGEKYLTSLTDTLIVEHKMDSIVRTAMRFDSSFSQTAMQKILEQARGYVALNAELGLGGIRYVVTETVPAEGAVTASTGLRWLLAEFFPEEVANGTLKVFSTPPRPTSFIR
ncbi:hypothetical protein AB0K00_48635 [Dactylosporangium sp. NPDC049525]|uniref:hypothetical protein n=1 Tax=Dactylosporangium sp. NPDC049525 TaxID=3154730 RepID=UPI003449D549